MPIYEYSCAKCGVFDHMQKITEKPLKKCPECGAKVAKLISNTAFQLKGSGWYITDYGRKGSGGADAKSEGSTSPGSTSSSDSSSDAKSGDATSSEGKGGGDGAKAGAKKGAKKGGDGKPGSSAAA